MSRAVALNAQKQVRQQLAKWGEWAVLRRVTSTFDEDTGEWATDCEEDYPIHLVAEGYSDMLRASGNLLEGQRRFFMSSGEAAIEPDEGAEDRKADQVYFGNWATEKDIDIDEATSSGNVTLVDRTARLAGVQIGFIVEVMTGGS